MLHSITVICFTIVTIMELNYFLLRKWRIKHHRAYSPMFTKLIILISWIGMLCSL